MNEAKIKELAMSIAELVNKKNADYGDSYMKLRDRFGWQSFIIRLYDKLFRLENLFQAVDGAKVDESIEDTLKDIIGYCLLELLYRETAIKDFDGIKTV